MAENFWRDRFPSNIPWFIFDLRNLVFITSKTIPGDIQDLKEIGLSETPIPGLNFQPVTNGGGGNRKISFSIPIIKRNNTVGNSLQIAQLSNLREQGTIVESLSSLFGNNLGFAPNPQVLFYYGIGFPTIWFVKKCDFVHKGGWVNELANPQYTDCELELWFDHTNPINKIEENYRRLAAYAGLVENSYELIAQQPLF